MLARVVTSVDGPDTRVKAVVVQIGDLIDKFRVDLTDQIQKDPLAACEELINLAVAHFTATSVDIPVLPLHGPARTVR